VIGQLGYGVVVFSVLSYNLVDLYRVRVGSARAIGRAIGFVARLQGSLFGGIIKGWRSYDLISQGVKLPVSSGCREVCYAWPPWSVLTVTSPLDVTLKEN
jgi:hypothetical protein